jgi:adenine-specific DNA-methyltransferase
MSSTIKTLTEEVENIEVLKMPLPMQYLGGKGRIVENIMDEIKCNFKDTTTFIDLFTGSGVVAYNAMNKGYKVFANDIQPYSSVIASSLIVNSINNLSGLIDFIKKLTVNELFQNSRSKYLDDFKIEELFISDLKTNNFDWTKYKIFCESISLFEGDEEEIDKLKSNEKWTLFLAYYRNTYFGIKQCAEIDYLRELCENLDEDLKVHLMASVVSSLTYCVSSTTHLAQFLKPSTERNSRNLLKRRSLSIIDFVIKRLNSIDKINRKQKGEVLNMDFKEALNELNLDSSCIVYADPPYFKEHYSRYYHVLDTFVLYDYPMLTYNKVLGKTTVGRYREDRLVSDFGKRSTVRNAFDSLLNSCNKNNCKLAISYACSSLVEKDFFLLKAKEYKMKLKTVEFELMHTGQGKSRHKKVTEYLFLFSNE